MIRKGTAKEWIMENWNNFPNDTELRKACVKEGWSRSNASQSLTDLKNEMGKNCMTNSEIKPIRKNLTTEEPGGIEALRQQFGRSVIAKKKMEKLYGRVDKVLNGILKEKKWMYFNSFCDFCEIVKGDQHLIRDEYNEWIIPGVLDENGRRYTIIAHPDHYDEVLEAINE